VEKRYLEEAGVEAKVFIRPMAVDFNDVRPLTEDERQTVRRRLGIGCDDVLVTTYVGIMNDPLGRIKGGHFVHRIWLRLKEALRGRRIAMVVTGIRDPYAAALRRLGIRVFERLPHRDFVRIVGASDAYFVPATSACRCGGVGVAVMEALAAGVPVVSPTLRWFPDQGQVRHIGVLTPWIDSDKDVNSLVDAMLYVIENRSQYNPLEIRSVSKKYYSWESFVELFLKVLSSMWSYALLGEILCQRLLCIACVNRFIRRVRSYA
jgi:glycosyltransferase involved in cell wall biosynthesis